MKVSKEQPKKLVYDLPKDLEYSKNGNFIKTKKLYIKEFVYGELSFLEEKLDDFLDEFENYREKGAEIFEKENRETIQEPKDSNPEDLKKKIELEKEIAKTKNDIQLMSALQFLCAKKGGLPTTYLKKALLPFLINYIYCDEEMTIKITEKNLKELGLTQRGLIDFFLLGELLPCYISSSLK